jgi:hypothetical protein
MAGLADETDEVPKSLTNSKAGKQKKKKDIGRSRTLAKPPY